MSTVQEAIGQLNKPGVRPNDRVCIMVIWGDDILQRAKQEGTPITTEDANDIIEALEENQKVGIAMSWHEVDNHIDNCVKTARETAALMEVTDG